MKKQWVLFLGIAGSILGSVWLVRQVSQKPAPEPVTITLADESARIFLCRQLHALCGDADTVRKAVLL